MSMTESRVVQISFDNKDFENNVKQSLDTLNRLNQALEFKDGAKGLNNISNAAKNVDLSNVEDSVSNAASHFSTLEVIGVTALANIANTAVNAGKQILSSFISPITKGGWQRALNMEQAKFMFEGLLGAKAKQAIGNVGQVGSIMDNIYQAVDGTVYSLDQAALIAARLMASGIEGTGENAEIVNILKGIAGVSSVFSADYSRVGELYSTIKSTGVLMGQQVLSFTTMGVPLYAKLAEYLNKIVKEGKDAGKSLKEMFPNNEKMVEYLGKMGTNIKITESAVKEMVSKGAIDFKTFSDAMYDAFGEQASKSKQLYIGALEDMKAAGARIGEKLYGPFIGKDGKPGVLRDILNASVPLLDAINARLSAEGGFFEQFGAKVRAVGDKIVLVFDLIAAALDFDSTKSGLERMVKEGLADESRLANLEKYGYAIVRIRDAFEALGQVFSVVSTIVMALASVARNAFQFVMGLAETVLTVVAGVQTPLKALKKTAKGVGTDLGGFIAAMTNVVVNSKLVAGVVDLVKVTFNNFDKVVKSVSKNTIELANTLMKIVNIIAKGLAKTLKTVVKELKGVVSITDILNTTIITSLMIKVGKLFELLKGSGMSFGNIIKGVTKRFNGSILNNLRSSSVLLAEALDQMRVTLIAYQKNLKANILLKIADRKSVV